LKGDHVLLFLKKDELGYYVQGGRALICSIMKTGWTRCGNPFETSVEAKTLSEFSAEIEAGGRASAIRQVSRP
jgi:hypothetical protein